MISIKRRFLYPLLLIAPLLFVTLSLFVGRYPISLGTIFRVIGANLFGLPGVSAVHNTIVWDIRLPRAIIGALVGASLAVSGAAFQGLFRNPLVSSGILGVSSGASFGAALAIVFFGRSPLAIHVSSFSFGIVAVALSYLVGSFYRATPAIMLVLGGVIVSSFFSSLLSLLKYVADPYNQLASIVFWLMGSLSSARMQDLLISGTPMIVGIVGILLLRWKINVLSLGDKEAQTLGINVRFYKGLIILFASLATAGAVCVSGVIGWVGLVIPHIGRILVGNDNRLLIPVVAV